MEKRESSFAIKILLCLVFILAFFNCYLLYKRVFAVSDSAVLDESVIDLKSKYLTTAVDYIRNSGLYIGDCLYTDIATHTQSNLKALFENTEGDCFIVCRISEFDCEQCVNYSVQKLMEHVKESSLNMKVLIFGQYNNEMSMKIQAEYFSELGEMTCYYVPYLNLPIDERRVPYFFILNKDMKVTDVFAPDRMTSNLTDLYLSEIDKKWGGA